MVISVEKAILTKFLTKSPKHRCKASTMKGLIAYGTRFGATARTSKEIGRVLMKEGFEVKIVDVQDEKIRDISSYDLIIVASGIKMDQWVAEAEDFLKKFRRQLAGKKLAIFVSSAMQALYKQDENQAKMESSRKAFLIDKAAKYDLKPIAFGLFGGVIDYDSLGLFDKNIVFETFKERFNKAGIVETTPGLYDTRDWNQIRNWAKEVSEKAKKK